MLPWCDFPTEYVRKQEDGKMYSIARRSGLITARKGSHVGRRPEFGSIAGSLLLMDDVAAIAKL